MKSLQFICTRDLTKIKKIVKSKQVISALDVIHTPPKLEDLLPRPPVVAIVGHIDHGKYVLD